MDKIKYITVDFVDPVKENGFIVEVQYNSGEDKRHVCTTLRQLSNKLNELYRQQGLKQ